MARTTETTWGARSFVAALVRDGRWRLVGGFVLSVAASLTEGIGLLLLVPILAVAGITGDASGRLDDVADSALSLFGARPTLGSLLALFVALVALRSVLVRERDLLLTRVQLVFVDDVRLSLHSAVMAAQWSTVSSIPRAEVLHALTNEVVRIGAGTRAVMEIVRGGTLSIAYLAVSMVLSPAASGIAAGVGVLLAVLGFPLVRRARALGVQLSDGTRRLYGAASDLLDGVKVAKAHAAERAHTELFARAVSDQQRAAIEFQRARGNTGVVQQVGAAGACAVLVWVAVGHLDVPAGRLLAIIFLLSRLLPLLTSVLQNAQQLANAMPAWASVGAMQARCDAAAEIVPAPDDRRSILLQRAMRLRGVSVRHAPFLPPVLHDVDVDIPARTTTAIVGPSGAGKSTLADVLVGLLLPVAGSVEIDDVILDAGSSRAWREQIAYVPQDPFLFPMTLAENLRFARPDATDAELWDVLALAAAAGFVAALPDGLQTVVGDRGSGISGGERQRIALARALLRRPQLLVLDEATSALDLGSEALVRDAIDGLQGELTIVVIAHRMSTVEHADQVIVLERGRVSEVGPWDALAWRPLGTAS